MQHVVVDRFRTLKLAVFTLATFVAIAWLWAPQPGAPALAIEPPGGAPWADAGVADEPRAGADPSDHHSSATAATRAP